MNRCRAEISSWLGQRAQDVYKVPELWRQDVQWQTVTESGRDSVGMEAVKLCFLQRHRALMVMFCSAMLRLGL